MTEQTNLKYTMIHDNIHCIKMFKGTRQSVEDMFEVITEVSTSHDGNGIILYLFDNSEAPDLPYRYVIQRAERWRKAMGFVPPSRNAIIYNSNSIMLYLVNMVMAVFNGDDTMSKLFKADEYDDAIAWLKSFHTSN